MFCRFLHDYYLYGIMLAVIGPNVNPQNLSNPAQRTDEEAMQYGLNEEQEMIVSNRPQLCGKRNLST